MTRIASALLLLAPALAGCGGGGASTPEEAFAAIRQAFAERNWGAMYDMLPPGWRKMKEGEWERGKKDGDGAATTARGLGLDPDEAKGMSWREVCVLILERQKEAMAHELDRWAEAEILEKKEEGNRCTLRIRIEGGEDELILSRTKGVWYAALRLPGF